MREQPHAAIIVMIPPPVIYALTFAAGLVVDRMTPWNPDWMCAEVVHWFGWALIIAALFLALGSAGFFVLRRTTLNPAGLPVELVTSGPFALSRNPMYISVTAIYLGAALALGKIWPLVLIALPWAFMNWTVIPFEEARLRNTFGQAYVEYCRRVRRWL